MALQVACSGNVANAEATATFAGVPNKRWTITGFMVTNSGATLGSTVDATITGLEGGTLTFNVSAAALGGPSNVISVQFSEQVNGSTVGGAITLSVPALGGGNAHCAATLFGRLL